nr:bifunctional diaminohydroxyphosphoribosylaminopyrimidine deaminase/5-amino-6-(5-phosphoribosylamino)uracil reductase RibD [Saprospiraceae bacterium]
MKDAHPHQLFMKRCLDLAALGSGKTLTNPTVGAVLVFEDRIIGEGWHRAYGKPHAEVEALNSVSAADRHLIPRSTLYVSLEPCSHFGKTPPCADLIINVGIPKVVIGIRDPNPLVKGNGIQKLKEAGIEVITPVLKEESSQLISAFSTNQHCQRPHVVLKFARSRDGFIGRHGERIALSDPIVNVLTHRLRARSQGIIVGRITAENDQAELSTRNFPGRNPFRIVFSISGVTDSSLPVFNNAAPTLLITNNPPENLPQKVTVIPFRENLKGVLEQLYSHFKISRLLVEGGKQILDLFLEQSLWDEVWEISCPSLLKSGIPAPKINPKLLNRSFWIRENQLENYRR